MNPTGNNSNTLLAIEPSTMVTVKKAPTNVLNDANSLENKVFSDVLSERQALSNATTTVVNRASATEVALRVSGEQGDAGLGFIITGLGNKQLGGNDLPVDGVNLPLDKGLLAAVHVSTETGVTVNESADTSVSDDASSLFNPYTATYTTIAADEFTAGNMSAGQQTELAQVASALGVRFTGVQGAVPNTIVANTQTATADAAVIAANSEGAAVTVASPSVMVDGIQNSGLTGATDGTVSTGAVAASMLSPVLNPSAQVKEQVSKADLAKLSLGGVASVDSQLGDSSALAPGRSEAGQLHRAGADVVAQTTIPVAVGKQGWDDAVTQKVMWMSSQQISKAEISLDPPELGSLHVRITTHGDQTSVSFSSNHAAVRDALDQNLPRLRDMMEGQGLDLADVNVADQRAGQEQRQADDSGVSSDGQYDVANEDGLDARQELPVQVANMGLVDQYV